MLSRAWIVILLGIGVLGGGCATLKPPKPEAPVYALEPVSTGVLAELSRDVRNRHGVGKSGFHLIPKNEEAMRWRLALIDHAQVSVDAQYFVWENDDAGLLIMERCVAAAERGVRVRMLVDDFYLAGSDHNLAAASHHPNLDIKIFNPQYIRGGGLGPAIEFLMNFGELNRRMHNKMLVVDNRIAVMGGRNVGNAYFGLSEKYNLCDLDVLTVGAVVPQISDDFDNYWNSEPAYPGRQLDRGTGPEDTAEVIRRFQERFATSSAFLRQTRFPLERSDWSRELRTLKTKLHPGTAVVLQDEPVTDKNEDRERFLESSPPLIEGEGGEEVLVVSPYLLPGDRYYASFRNYVDRGARVRILTGSMGANDQAVAHAHYRGHRRPIIRTGAELYELRHDPSAALREYSDSFPARNGWVGLHMKGFTGDSKRCFIGTLNLDPRSFRINTECGLLIDSPGLAREMAEHIDFMMATENAWAVRTAKEEGKGALFWESSEEVVTIQPARTVSQRIGDFFFGLLPIEEQL